MAVLTCVVALNVLNGERGVIDAVMVGVAVGRVVAVPVTCRSVTKSMRMPSGGWMFVVVAGLRLTIDLVVADTDAEIVAIDGDVVGRCPARSPRTRSPQVVDAWAIKALEIVVAGLDLRGIAEHFDADPLRRPAPP